VAYKHFVFACKNHQCPFDFEIPSVNGLSRKGGVSMYVPVNNFSTLSSEHIARINQSVDR
jgi:hypothetical protein